MNFSVRYRPKLVAGIAAFFLIASVEIDTSFAIDIGFEAPNYSSMGGQPVFNSSTFEFESIGILARQGNSPPPHDDANPCERTIYGDAADEVGCWGNSFNPDGFRVAEGVGIDGSQALVNSGGDFYRYKFTTDDDLLGFTDGETFDNTSSILDYSIKFQLNNTAPDSVVGDAFNFGVIGKGEADPVMQIKISDNNRVGIVHPDSSNPAGTFTSSFNEAPNDPMLGPGEWQTISGQIDYGTQTFTVFINGNQWTFESPGDSGNYNFVFNDSDALDGANLLLIAANTPNMPGDQQADYIIDDFSLNVASLATSPADFDADGLVDGTDLGIWEDNYGLASPTNGDADADLDADGTDFLIWQREFTGTPALAAANAVPEPASCLLAFGAVVSFVVGARQRG